RETERERQREMERAGKSNGEGAEETQRRGERYRDTDKGGKRWRDTDRGGEKWRDTARGERWRDTEKGEKRTEGWSEQASRRERERECWPLDTVSAVNNSRPSQIKD